MDVLQDAPFVRAVPLKLETVTETYAEPFVLRYPKDAETVASEVVKTLRLLLPVVESNLGQRFQGSIRVDLLAEARVSGVNAATGIIRHALAGFREPSPYMTRLLAYQLGHILWYRGSRQAHYRGRVLPRSPDWLLEAALLPLMYAWTDRQDWLDVLADKMALFKQAPPLANALLTDMTQLKANQKSLASAQCLLRAQSLSEVLPDWHRRVCSLLARDPWLEGIEALELATSRSIDDWEASFAADLELWAAQASIRRVPQREVSFRLYPNVPYSD